MSYPVSSSGRSHGQQLRRCSCTGQNTLWSPSVASSDHTHALQRQALVIDQGLHDKPRLSDDVRNSSHAPNTTILRIKHRCPGTGMTSTLTVPHLCACPGLRSPLDGSIAPWRPHPLHPWGRACLLRLQPCSQSGRRPISQPCAGLSVSPSSQPYVRELVK